jgi:hydroxypyruvate isomerase
MDESPRQLISETRTPIPCLPGQPARYDYEYRRCGTCNIFLACEPLAGKRIVEVTERRTRQDWAQFLKVIADHYSEAEKITLVMDNLNTHTPGSFCFGSFKSDPQGSSKTDPPELSLLSPP